MVSNHSLKEDNRPSTQWYWGDWFSEFGLRLCSLAARGLWVDMLGIMFKAEIRGTLTVNGRQINGKGLAKILGEDKQIIDELIAELEANDVFDRIEDGTIISRRMYRESKKQEEISKIRSEAGRKGMEARWGRGDNKTDNKKITNITASSSTATSTSSSKEDTPNGVSSSLFEQFWVFYPKKVGKKVARKRWEQLNKTQQTEAIRAAENYAKKCRDKKTESEYIKNPEGFLNKSKEYWKDYLTYKSKADTAKVLDSKLDKWAKEGQQETAQ